MMNLFSILTLSGGVGPEFFQQIHVGPCRLHLCVLLHLKTLLRHLNFPESYLISLLASSCPVRVVGKDQVSKGWIARKPRALGQAPGLLGDRSKDAGRLSEVGMSATRHTGHFAVVCAGGENGSSSNFMLQRCRDTHMIISLYIISSPDYPARGSKDGTICRISLQAYPSPASDTGTQTPELRLGNTHSTPDQL